MSTGDPEKVADLGSAHSSSSKLFQDLSSLGGFATEVHGYPLGLQK